jgi:hypothetical protein
MLSIWSICMPHVDINNIAAISKRINQFNLTSNGYINMLGVVLHSSSWYFVLLAIIISSNTGKPFSFFSDFSLNHCIVLLVWGNAYITFSCLCCYTCIYVLQITNIVLGGHMSNSHLGDAQYKPWPVQTNLPESSLCFLQSLMEMLR